MKVSIIVPVYNVEKYLSKCIDSLIHQTYSDIEILLVNDGSLDHSPEIMKKYAREDKRIRCLNKKNGGLSDARNYGLLYAEGEYCLFVDSDDYLDIRAVELCVNSAEQYRSDIVVFDMKYIYSDRVEIAGGGDFACTSFSENKEVIFINNSACNKMFKRSLFQDVKFPVGMWYEDLATIPILLFRAKKISKIDVPLYYYVQREGSIAHTINNKIFDIYKAIHIVEDCCSVYGMQEEIKNMYIRHGLYLTTIRIKESSDEILKYLKLNNTYLDKYLPEWRSIRRFNGYSIKSVIIFKLLQKDKFKLVQKLYRK